MLTTGVVVMITGFGECANIPCQAGTVGKFVEWNETDGIFCSIVELSHALGKITAKIDPNFVAIEEEDCKNEKHTKQNNEH